MFAILFFALLSFCVWLAWKNLKLQEEIEQWKDALRVSQDTSTTYRNECVRLTEKLDQELEKSKGDHRWPGTH